MSGLEQSVVFHQLEARTRFSRIDVLDACIVCFITNIHGLLALITGTSMGRAFITLGTASLAVYFLKSKFPDGLRPLINVMTTANHLNALARDRMVQGPYPAARPHKR